jgi:hypothetical protein
MECSCFHRLEEYDSLRAGFQCCISGRASGGMSSSWLRRTDSRFWQRIDWAGSASLPRRSPKAPSSSGRRNGYWRWDLPRMFHARLRLLISTTAATIGALACASRRTQFQGAAGWPVALPWVLAASLVIPRGALFMAKPNRSRSGGSAAGRRYASGSSDTATPALRNSAHSRSLQRLLRISREPRLWAHPGPFAELHQADRCPAACSTAPAPVSTIDNGSPTKLAGLETDSRWKSRRELSALQWERLCSRENGSRGSS